MLSDNSILHVNVMLRLFDVSVPARLLCSPCVLLPRLVLELTWRRRELQREGALVFCHPVRVRPCHSRQVVLATAKEPDKQPCSRAGVRHGSAMERGAESTFLLGHPGLLPRQRDKIYWELKITLPYREGRETQELVEEMFYQTDSQGLLLVAFAALQLVDKTSQSVRQ